MPVKRPKKLSPGEEEFALQCRAMGVHMIREHRFHPDRMWRADFCNTSRMIIVEIDGGNRMATIGRDGKAYAIGRHTQEDDYAKLNEAALLGYRIFRFTAKMVTSGYAITMMLQEFKKEASNVP